MFTGETIPTRRQAERTPPRVTQRQQPYRMPPTNVAAGAQASLACPDCHATSTCSASRSHDRAIQRFGANPVHVTSRRLGRGRALRSTLTPGTAVVQDWDAGPGAATRRQPAVVHEESVLAQLLGSLREGWAT
jgi:hypothetical protein